MPYRALIALGMVSFAVLAGGCKRVYTFTPVAGTVTKGGQPLAGVQVVFFPDPDSGTEGPQSCGTTDAMGRYRLRTDRGEDGVVVGKHRVCIVELFFPESPADAFRRGEIVSSKSNVKPLPKEPAESKVPAIYGQINKTPLQAEVRPGGMQTFDFNIP